MEIPKIANPNKGLSSAPGGRMQADFSNLAYERLQPQALDLEAAVLGAVMLDKDAISVAVEILRPESFYAPAHQTIFKAMISLFNHSQPVDLLTVSEQLRKMEELENVGGLAYILELSNKISSSANTEFYSRIVAQKYVQRELIRVCTLIIKDAFEDTKDVLDMLDVAEQSLYEITDKNLRKGYQSVGSLARMAQKRLEELSDSSDGITGIPSGFPELDQLTSGWQKSNLIIVAARPGMGKTAFTLALARNAAVDYRKPVAIFSLEMNNLELVNRLISMESEIQGSKLRNGKLEEYEWTQLNFAIEKLSDAPLFIDDTPSLNVFELRAKCRRLHQNHGISMVIIDYLQLMTVGGNDKRSSREQEISTISRALKGLAKELNIPVIALSQLNRQVETGTGNKKPQLSHLRESGAIEQDADMVMFIYRENYYDTGGDIAAQEVRGLTELIIAKHRNGATDTIKVLFKENFAKFVPYEEDQNVFGFGSTPNIKIIPSKINDDDTIPF